MVLALSITVGLLMAAVAYWIVFDGWQDFVECVLHPLYYYHWVARDTPESELQELDWESSIKSLGWVVVSVGAGIGTHWGLSAIWGN